MKNFDKIMLVSLILAVISSCDKYNYNKNEFLIGTWINIEQNDTLIFLTNDRMDRPHDYYYDWFEYFVTSDSLSLQYSGPDKILLPLINFGYELIGDTLLIDFHQDYYPNFNAGLKRYLKK